MGLRGPRGPPKVSSLTICARRWPPPQKAGFVGTPGQVRRNKGAPGVDGMTVDDLPLYLKPILNSENSGMA